MQMRIVAATDGSDAALGALRLTRALAERHGAAVEVVTVVEPIPVYGINAPDRTAYVRGELERAAQEALRQRAAGQLAGLGPAAAAWPITVEVGVPARAIVRLAQEKGATLIALGLGGHSLADRWFGTETALRVMRLSHLPVLAAAAEATELPRVAVIAVDFTDFSQDAARSALQVLAPLARVHLTHVRWRAPEEAPWVGGIDWIEEYRESLRERLDDFARELTGMADARIETHLLQGDPAHEVLRLSQREHADLLAAGSHGTGFLGRLLMGSVSTRLVRGATCSVLITPPRSVPAELEAETSAP